MKQEEPKQETLTNDTDSHSWGFENFEIIKTEEDAKIFVETMENIPEPNDKLKKAFRDFNKQETLEEVAENYGWRIKRNTFSDTLKANELAESAKQDFISGAKWQQQQNKNLYSILDENYDLNIQFHQAIRESIFSFAVAVYDEKLTFEEWTKKHYGKHIEVSKNLYSEEEVLEQLNLLYSMKNSLVDTFTDKNDRITMKWFEQFKNK